MIDLAIPSRDRNTLFLLMKTQPFAANFSHRDISSDEEEQKIIDILSLVLEGLGGTMPPNTEIILHDIRTPAHSTHTIINGHVSGRQVGDPIIAAPVDDQGLDLLYQDQPPSKGISASIGHYRSRMKDGRELKSATVLFRNRQGKAFASVCTNTDLSEYQSLHASLQKLLGVDQEAPQAALQEQRPTVDDLIEEMVSSAVNLVGKPAALMDKNEKMQIVFELLKRGVFVIKGSVERVAHSLSVSRFTIYNYLEELGYSGGAKAASKQAQRVSKKAATVKALPTKAKKKTKTVQVRQVR
ncbi:PAS domain-containing protein [Paraburkholderia sp.]|uniref:helix-turn-helix transcriptional regulator n=1 Tax=Paraburkholderia sp. TaxID=1926495 RepID=UPI0023A4557F|nr:PAS domain-containing protein [Paraburkholderia sp.]MDE1181865.1 PAS domain-containing protein [Paraburkholderia sp.]